MSKTSTAFFIAKRYLFSKKKHHAINIISVISMLAVVVGSMALVCVMSVFNGFQELVASLFTEFESPWPTAGLSAPTTLTSKP